MAAWRSVRGHIERLDPYLTSHEDILAFFEEERILGRGQRSDEGEGYEFEVAVVGRRRRVATLDDEGAVIRGISVGDLLVLLQERLRKVAIELGGKVVHGPIDLGSVDVDVDDYDLDPELLEELAAEREGYDADGSADADANQAAAEFGLSQADVEDNEASDDVTGDAIPDLDDGPMMVISDISMSEMPPIANAEDMPISVSKLGDARVMVAEESLTAYRRTFPRPNYVIALSTDRSKEKNPALIVRRDNTRILWDWSGEYPAFEWIKGNEVAQAFVDDELGAGAVARLAVADIIDARFADVRSALLRDHRDGTDAIVRALGLPVEIGDVLEGRRGLESIPDSQLFQPKPVAGAFEDTLAWEIAGEGVVEPGVMKAVRQLYIDRPWMVAVGSAAQAALSGAVLGVAYTRARRGIGSKTLFALGAASLIGAFTRIGTTTYMQHVVDRSRGEIDTWRNVRDWQENIR